jgi:hypothetical protein
MSDPSRIVNTYIYGMMVKPLLEKQSSEIQKEIKSTGLVANNQYTKSKAVHEWTQYINRKGKKGDTLI